MFVEQSVGAAGWAGLGQHSFQPRGLHILSVTNQG